MKLKNKNLIAVLAIMILIFIYTCPLLLNMHKAPYLYPKNIMHYYGVYTDLLFWREAVINHLQLPLWTHKYEGGTYLFGFPASNVANPMYALLIFFKEIEVDKMIWVSFYMIGALSMFFLCRGVLKYNIYGAIFASIVFSMSGYFASLQHAGFVNARPMLLLPLLIGLLFKAQVNKKYIVYSSIVLAFTFFEAYLYVPVTVLFIFIIMFLSSFNLSNKFLKFDNIFLKRSLYICILAFLFSSVKNISTISSFGLTLRPSGIAYEHSLENYNNFWLLYQRLISPIEQSPGMFIGHLPLLLSLLSALIYFKQAKVFVISLVLAIWLSFGPNAVFDLHKVLWHLPLFHEIREIEKYYGIFIILFLSILGGRFFLLFEKLNKKRLGSILSLLLITYVFLSLSWANIGYFNAFRTQLPVPKDKNRTFFNVMYLNIHQGDESISAPLLYFFLQNNVGSIYNGDTFKKKTAVMPKYFLLPRYSFLMPYTSLLVLPNPLYKGEAFLLKPGSKINILKFTANELIMNIQIVEPDVLIINQNYDGGWRASAGKIENYNNLLAVRFDRPVNCKLRLIYCPRIFLIGLAISLSALIAGGIYVFRF